MTVMEKFGLSKYKKKKKKKKLARFKEKKIPVEKGKT